MAAPTCALCSLFFLLPYFPPLWCVARSQWGTAWVAALRHWQLRKLNSEAESVKSMTKSVLFFYNNWNNIIILRLNFYCWWFFFKAVNFFAFSLYQDPFKYILGFLMFFGVFFKRVEAVEFSRTLLDKSSDRLQFQLHMKSYGTISITVRSKKKHIFIWSFVWKSLLYL